MAQAIDARADADRGVVLGWLPGYEVIAWGAIGLTTLALRLVGIGDPPLNPDEGRRALEGLTLFREWRVAYEAGPLLPNLLSFVFALFTPGDGQARLPSALFGTLLVLAPWLLRPVLGAGWSLGAALALAVSPPLVVLSRTVSPAIFGLGFLLLTVACGWRYAQDRDRRWLVGALAAVALGLASDPSLTVGLAGALLAYAIAEGDVGTLRAWFPTARAAVGRAALVALGVGVLVSTRLLMNPIGVQAGLIDPLWTWSGDVARGSGLRAPLLFLLEDGGTLLLAAIGAARYRCHPRSVRFLGVWLIIALTLASLMRQPDARYLFQPSVPAALLGGLGLVCLWERLRAHASSRTVVVGLAALVPLVTATIQINAGLRQDQDPWIPAAVVAAAGLLLVALLAFNILAPGEVGSSAATFALVLVAFGTVAGASRWLEARGSDRGHLVDTAVLTADVRTVREHALAWYRADPFRMIPVEPALRPIVAWALRDIPTVRFDASAATQPVPRLLAAPPTQVEPNWEAVRVVVGYATDGEAASLGPAQLWSWLVQRQSLVGVRPYAIVLVQPAGR
ncbi:MAG: glycosyltransferase family 39 protein [Chloroflexota bacterium]|nr:glycosyltransferase family 39 protein [Chloroflexota bacterium]